MIKPYIGALLLFLLMHGVPPEYIPEELYNHFTLNRSVDVTYWYRDDTYASEEPLVYTKEVVDQNLALIAGKYLNYYGSTDAWLYQALEKYGRYIEGKAVGIIGSTTPWYESVALYYGGSPTTIEYNAIFSTDSRLCTMTVAEYEQNPVMFDALFSISSFEHDGLGRYGDPIDPFGDIKAMKKAYNMLNDEGLLFLSVPIGKDHLWWNVHRVYGKIRFPLLIAGWELIDSFGFSENDFLIQSVDVHQPVFVLKKIVL